MKKGIIIIISLLIASSQYLNAQDLDTLPEEIRLLLEENRNIKLDYKKQWADTKDAFLGTPAIDFKATATNGEDFLLSDYRGEVVVLLFWSVISGRAKGDELKDFEKVCSRYDDEPVAIWTFADYEEIDINGFLSRNNIEFKYPIVPNSHEFLKTYIGSTLLTYPMLLIIDKNGIVRNMYTIWDDYMKPFNAFRDNTFVKSIDDLLLE